MSKRKTVLAHQLEALVGLKKPLPVRMHFSVDAAGNMSGGYPAIDSVVAASGVISIVAIYELKAVKRFRRVTKEVKDGEA